MRALYGFVFGLWVLTWTLTSALVVGTLGVLPFAIVPRRIRFRYAMPSAQLWARGVLASMLVRLRIEGDWPLDPDRGALIFCNHRSWLDPLVLMATCRSNGLSKSQILWIPFVGVYGWLSGAVFFNRRDREQRSRARDLVVELAENGHRLQIFPEGTRNLKPGTREQVYLTLGIDAFKRGIPVVPCAVVNSEQVLPPGRPACYPGIEVVLRFGEPLDPTQFRTGRDYAAATWKVVRELYDRG